MKMPDVILSWLINDYGLPAISKQRLFEAVFTFTKVKCYKNEKIEDVRKNTNIERLFAKVIDHLIQISFFESSMYFTEKTPYFVKNKADATPDQLVCSVYPYGYISHISAMKWHGLTDRLPKHIDFTSCSRLEWKTRSILDLKNRMDVFDSEYQKHLIPGYPSDGKYFGQKLLSHTTSKFIEPKTASDGVRVQDIGFLFIDMLRYPDFCGGFDHVLDVFEDCAFIYQNAILNAANTIGSDIDKARIGFLFEKKLGLHSNILEEWKPKMQRGGSRKLVVNKPFDSCYDDLWAISINHKELHKYGQYKQHEQLD